jgi:hypothetical protein
VKDKTPLRPGELEGIVRETFHRNGIEDIGPSTPAALFVTVAKWDGLLNAMELRGLRMLVRELTPMTVEFGE